MKLYDMLSKIESLDGDLTIYALEPWTCDSDAIVEFEPEDGGLPPEVEEKGMKYFLEVFVAQEFLDGWMKSQVELPSDKEKCERLIQYAIRDA